MCGIAGIINLDETPVDIRMLRDMTNIIKHRGPDDEGFYIKGRAGLGHRRLSIIDLSQAGHQPMCNEDETVWITFNGEIYNYKSVSEGLKARGHLFRSNCDTETIVHAYEAYGEKCVDHLRGMFSFAIWDERQNRFFAAVDRLRIKPFYYTLVGDTFLFASEIKALIASGLVEKKLNYEAIHHYLSLQAIPVPMTIYENVYTLPGGHTLEIADGQVKVSCYWDIPHQPHAMEDEETAKKKVRDLVWESVEMRMMSDVPLGAFLSGGIDSSAIVAVMSQVSSQPVQTFSIGYDVGGASYDDTYYANLVSKRFGTDHKCITVTAADVLSRLPGFLTYLDQPSSDAINSYFVSELAARDVTVVLCGQGGDELFAGYNSFALVDKFMRRDAKWERLPPFVRSTIAGSVQRLPQRVRSLDTLQKFNRFLGDYGSFVNKYARIRMELYEEEKRRVYTEDFASRLNGANTFAIYEDYCGKVPAEVEPINKVSYLDLKTHLGDILMRDVDAMSMTFALETRVPLIDHKLVEYASGIPAHLKLKHGTTKYIFVESVRGLLPTEVVERKKLGFNFPFAIWLRKELYPLVEFVLSREVVEARGMFRYDEIDRLKRTFLTSDITYRRIWGFVLLELWLRHVHDGDTEFLAKALDTVKGRSLAAQTL
ncbi:MAG: asparagine synthase (glutamine-hydrolyzing) [bacterium]